MDLLILPPFRYGPVRPLPTLSGTQGLRRVAFDEFSGFKVRIKAKDLLLFRKFGRQLICSLPFIQGINFQMSSNSWGSICISRVVSNPWTTLSGPDTSKKVCPTFSEHFYFFRSEQFFALWNSTLKVLNFFKLSKFEKNWKLKVIKTSEV